MRATTVRSGGLSLLNWVIGFSLVLVSGVTLCCDSDDTKSTTWSGAYTISDNFGGGSGALSFIVTDSDSVFCFTFSGKASSYSTSCNNPGTGGFPINSLQFSIPLTTSEGTFTLTGQFASSPEATGKIVGPPGSPETVLTWTATDTSTANQSAIRSALNQSRPVQSLRIGRPG